MFFKKQIIPEKIILEVKCDERLIELLNLFRVFIANYLTGKESDLRKLKLEIMRPIIENQWDKTNAEEADRISRALESKGEKVRKAYEQYKDDLLTSEKQHKDTSLIKAKLEILEKLLEGVE